MNRLYLILILGAALAASVIGNAYQWRNCAVDKAKAIELANTRATAAELAATQSARATERAQNQAAFDVAESYEKGKADAQATADRFVADLRSDNLRLRNRWQGCPASGVPNSAAATRELDAETADRIESAGRIIGAAAACDAQVTAWQDFYLSVLSPWLPGAPRP